MGVDRALHAYAEATGATPKSAVAGGCRGSDVYPVNGVSVASIAARFSEAVFGAVLLLRVAERWVVGTYQFLSLANGPRTRESGSKPLGRMPCRWVVERTLAWFGRNRRLAKDFETTIASGEAWLWLASVQLLTRRLAR